MDEKKLTEKPGYYAVIPASVRYDKSLSPNAKLLYGEITALLNFKNKCFATNAYFARLYEISEVQVSRLIKQLVDGKHVFTEMSVTPKGTERLIYIALNINDNTPLIKNDNRGVIKNDKHNNKSINNASLFDNKEDADFCFIKEFNTLRNSKFQLTIKSKWRENLRERLREGYKVKDIIEALKNAMASEYHAKNNFNDLTPEFITRQDKLEKYANFIPTKKEEDKPQKITMNF